MSETPIAVLRVEQTTVSKELLRFRSCDVETRSMYCREWAQYVYKKHFVWNAKTQEEVIQDQAETIQAGKYQIKLLDKEDELEVDYGKLKSIQWIQQFEKQSLQGEEMLHHMIQACRQWILSPSAHSGLPDIFQPIEFNSYPDTIPLDDGPSQLLDPLIIERQSLCLPADCFHLLKGLTGDIILSHTTPTCDHRKPEAKTPADLEVERAILTEHGEVAVKQTLDNLGEALEFVWQPLQKFLEQLEEQEKTRSVLMGQKCQASVDDFFTSQKYTPFVDHWVAQAAVWKKKKNTEEELKSLDDYVQNYFNHLIELVDEFLNKFVKARFKEIHDWNSSLFEMAVSMLKNMKEPLETLEQFKIDQAIMVSETRITKEMGRRAEEFKQEIQDMLKAYYETPRSSLSGRMDKLNNKDFKKRIKKVESGYYSLRQHFRYELTENFFPESFFGRFVLICLSPLMMKGEIMEVVAIKGEMQRFVETHKDLLKERFVLLSQFEEGVHTGRRELAGIVGKVLLKEGMRLQGESVALQRQNTLLKTFGVTPTESESKKKKSKGKKKSDSGASTPLQENKNTPSSDALFTKLSEAKKEEAKARKQTPLNVAELTKEKEKPTEKKQESDKKEPVNQNQEPSNDLGPPKTHVVKRLPPKPLVPVPEVNKEIEKSELPSVPTTKSSTESSTVKKPAPKIAKPAQNAPLIRTPSVAKPVSIPQSAKKAVEKPKKYVSKVAPAPVLDPPIPKTSEVVKKPTKSSDSSKKTKTPAVKKEETIREVSPRPDEEKAATETQNQELPTAVETLTDAAVKSPIQPIVESLDNPAIGWNDLVAQVTEEGAGSWDIKTTPTDTAIDKLVTTPSASTETNREWTAPANAQEAPAKNSGWNTIAETSSKWNDTLSVANEGNQGWNPASEETSKDWTPASEEANQGWDPVSEETSKDWTPASEEPNQGWDPVSEETSQGWNPAFEESSQGWGSTSKEVKQGWGDNSTNAKQDWNSTSGSKGWSEAKSHAKKSNPEWRRKDTAAPEWRAFNNQTEKKSRDDLQNANSNGKAEGWGPSKDTKKKTWSTPKENKDLPNWDNASGQASEGWRKAPSEGFKQQNDWNNSQASWDPKVERHEKSAAPPVTMKPPGLPFLNQESVPFAQPPGLSFGSAKPPETNGPSSPFHPFMPSVTTQLQEPLPGNVDEFGKDMLLLMVKNLHRENSTLISSVYSLQQDMAMMNKRYNEVMALTREREAQTVQLLETRQQTELEKAKAYVLSLESRLKEMEQKNAQDRPIAGFGNQDLFAGYRDEMKSPNNPNIQKHSHKKLWQKSTVIRCGNCGETGHSSSDCTGYCRYCGSLEHLSESCPIH
ncbi:hypothetical protein BY458DRAFT_510542 [Sporodiniella umbellata]|nr:hypothetical protein BY458DRAFT_510542 [Sporodiniella umbellata]